MFEGFDVAIVADSCFVVFCWMLLLLCFPYFVFFMWSLQDVMTFRTAASRMAQMGVRFGLATGKRGSRTLSASPLAPAVQQSASPLAPPVQFAAFSTKLEMRFHLLGFSAVLTCFFLHVVGLMMAFDCFVRR